MLRSWLYVPGDRPDRVAKAMTLVGDAAPDAVILDLEDAVAPSAKSTARAAVAAVLGDAGPPAGPRRWVRVNNGPLLAADVEDVGSAFAGADGVVVPKATLAEVDRAARLLDAAGAPDLPLVALVESAQGLLDAPGLARHHRVRNLALGEVDLRADLGLRPDVDEAALVVLRLGVVVASAAAGIEPPTAPVSTAIDDPDGLAATTAVLAALGFGARSAVHPSQVPVINAAFTPTAEEVAAARALVEHYDAALARGEGVVVGPDGRMVDEAVVRAARRLSAC